MVKFLLIKMFLCRPSSVRLSFTSWVAVVGVACGVTAFLVVVTVLTSFEKELSQQISKANPNVVVFYPEAQARQDFLKGIHQLSNNTVVGESPFAYTESIALKGSHMGALALRGIVGTKTASYEDLVPMVTPQSALGLLDVSHQDSEALPPILVGQTFAQNFELNLHDELTLMAVDPADPENLNVTYHKVRVVGFVHTGISEYDRQIAYINTYDLARIFLLPSWSVGEELKLTSPDQAQTLAQAIRSQTEGSAIAWQEIDSRLFAQIQRDGTAIRLMIFIVLLVSGLNVVVTLRLTVSERTRHIAILRSLGARRPQILQVFLIAGTVIGVLGSLLGVLSGFLILEIASHVSLGSLQQFYYLEKIPVTLNGWLTLQVVGLTVVLTACSALLPAWLAMRIVPRVGLGRSVR